MVRLVCTLGGLNAPKDKVTFLKTLGVDPAAMIARQGLLIALSAFWIRGYLDLPACSPRHGSIFINKASKTLARVQASRGGRCKTFSGVA